MSYKIHRSVELTPPPTPDPPEEISGSVEYLIYHNGQFVTGKAFKDYKAAVKEWKKLSKLERELWEDPSSSSSDGP